MLRHFTVLILVVGSPWCAAAKDWPTYRGDAARSGWTDESLPAGLALRWSYHPRHPPQPAWPREERVQFDRAFHVAVAGGLVFFGSSADGKVYALDAAGGTERWSFFTDGPVRLAPTVHRDRVFVASDDGWLYCLNAQDGALQNKWRGGHDETRVLGNGYIISKWPARGGVAIADGVLYWAAGLWQSEGVYLRAMNPDTGRILWRNTTSGQIELPQPHGGAVAVSGVTPQGYLAVNAEQLFVPTGRAVPAAFARADGKFQYYRLQENGQRGGALVMAHGPCVYNGGFAYRAADGTMFRAGRRRRVPVPRRRGLRRGEQADRPDGHLRGKPLIAAASRFARWTTSCCGSFPTYRPGPPCWWPAKRSCRPVKSRSRWSIPPRRRPSGRRKWMRSRTGWPLRTAACTSARPAERSIVTAHRPARPRCIGRRRWTCRPTRGRPPQPKRSSAAPASAKAIAWTSPAATAPWRWNWPAARSCRSSRSTRIPSGWRRPGGSSTPPAITASA